MSRGREERKRSERTRTDEEMRGLSLFRLCYVCDCEALRVGGVALPPFLNGSLPRSSSIPHPIQAVQSENELGAQSQLFPFKVAVSRLKSILQVY